MKNIWNDLTLKDIFDFYNGKSIKPGGEGKYPAYGANGIIGGSSDHMHENAIIIGRVGAYCGAVAYCFDKFWASDNTIVAKTKETNIKFGYYFLKNMNLNSYAGGAAQPLMTQTVIKSIEVKYPSSLHTQQKIASILSVYDDLIENNTRRIKILEEMTQRIYREWFVHFRFPGHEKVKMVKSELGMIPEGWEVKLIEDLYNTTSGGTPSRKKEEYYGGEINWLKTKELNDNYIIDTEEKITEIGLQKSSAKIIPKDTVIMAMYGATIGKLGILSLSSTTNQACCAFLPKDEYFIFPYIFGHLYENREDVINHGMGAAQQNLSQVIIKKLKLLRPSNEIVKEYNKMVCPLFEMLKVLQLKHSNLRQTRDLLLPKLISGKIDVEDLDIDTGALVA